MDHSYRTYLRYLRLLMARANALSDRNRKTELRELGELRRGAVTCLALLGPKVESIHRQVAQLEFRKPYRAGRYGSGTIFDEAHAYQTLDDLLGLLKTAFRILQNTAAIEPAHTTDSPPPKIRRALATSPYSEADARLYALIGSMELQTLTNPELWKRYRRPAEKELERRVSDHAFRAMVNRVRKHHGFPKSKDLGRKLINKRRTD